MPKQLTLYSSKTSAFGQYVEIALLEAKAPYTRYEVDLLVNKPSWFAEKVNPAGLVPAITYGGPITPPEEPSAKSHKLSESLVLLEFITDLYPDADLMPKDPILRASVRFFINAIATKFITAWRNCMIQRESPEQLLDAIEAIQKLLPDKREGKFVTGNSFTSADAVAGSWFIRTEVYLKHDFGSYKEGEGRKTYEVLQQSHKYARYRSYVAALRERESVKKTIDEIFLEQVYGPTWLKYRA